MSKRFDGFSATTLAKMLDAGVRQCKRITKGENNKSALDITEIMAYNSVISAKLKALSGK